jgi:hypothetical protein
MENEMTNKAIMNEKLNTKYLKKFYINFLEVQLSLGITMMVAVANIFNVIHSLKENGILLDDHHVLNEVVLTGALNDLKRTGVFNLEVLQKGGCIIKDFYICYVSSKFDEDDIFFRVMVAQLNNGYCIEDVLSDVKYAIETYHYNT